MTRTAPPQTSSASSGSQAELQACDYLLARGLKLVEKNYRCKRGEIDLIMRDGNSLVFVEVRYRKNFDYGGAAASITAKKQEKLQLTALHYMQHRSGQCNVRFDVIAITGTGRQQQLEWISNAF